MQANPTQQNTIERQNEDDAAVIRLLIYYDDHRPLSVDEVGLATHMDPVASLRRLQAGGLIHRLDQFVWASRAALMADDIHE